MKKILIVVAFVCLAGQTAFAQAFIERASPAVGSEVTRSPPDISLSYTEPVEPLFSIVHVTNSHGARVDEGKPTPKDDGRVLVVRLKKLPPGVYTVESHVTSVDIHKTQGEFTQGEFTQGVSNSRSDPE